MLETVRIRRQGYPVRFSFADFAGRFQFLLPPEERKAILEKPKDGSIMLIKYVKLPTTDYQIGKTKIFMKDRPAALYYYFFFFCFC